MLDIYHGRSIDLKIDILMHPEAHIEALSSNLDGIMMKDVLTPDSGKEV